MTVAHATPPLVLLELDEELEELLEDDELLDDELLLELVDEDVVPLELDEELLLDELELLLLDDEELVPPQVAACGLLPLNCRLSMFAKPPPVFACRRNT